MSMLELARAKVNLALHVVGQRADGYHLLDTLVAFPGFSDVLRLERAENLTLAICGPGARALSGLPVDDNLVMRAARALADLVEQRTGRRPGAALHLEKQLPTASGLGGGSADAAAALRLLSRAWDVAPSDSAVIEIATRLGADVPMCLTSQPLRASGIGEILVPVPDVPALGILLAHPGVAVSTPEVFRRLENKNNGPLPDRWRADTFGFLAALAACRNDLEAPAQSLAPVITDVLEALSALEGVALVRMSGSGATCFALFATADMAIAAADGLSAARPDWWVRAAPLRTPCEGYG